jgi:Domain of unknown function (DU1801)
VKRRARASKPKLVTGAAAERQLADFIEKYPAALAADARASRRKLRQRVPGAIELVYDNYNGLVIGFGPNDRPSDAVLSLLVSPGGWVTLCFLEGAHLTDPDKLLRGAGNRVRHIRLGAPNDLDSPPVRALLAEALKAADPPFDPRARRRLIIRSVSARQRPRRVGRQRSAPKPPEPRKV